MCLGFGKPHVPNGPDVYDGHMLNATGSGPELGPPLTGKYGPRSALIRPFCQELTVTYPCISTPCCNCHDRRATSRHGPHTTQACWTCWPCTATTPVGMDWAARLAPPQEHAVAPRAQPSTPAVDARNTLHAGIRHAAGYHTPGCHVRTELAARVPALSTRKRLSANRNLLSPYLVIQPALHVLPTFGAQMPLLSPEPLTTYAAW